MTRAAMAAATTVGAALALTVGAQPAGAALLPRCAGADIAGTGVGTVQAGAQALWTAAFSTSADGCPGGPRVTFAVTGSGHPWRGGTGSGCATSAVFVAVDDPPSASELADMLANCGSNLVVVPVLQTSIAVVARPPLGCTIDGTIGNALLERVFRGVATRWSELPGALGSTCASGIGRVVRTEEGAVPRRFKLYLDAVAGGRALTTCTSLAGSTWAALAATPALSRWPNSGACTPLLTVIGDGGVAAAVASTYGSMGFVSAPALGSLQALRVQNRTFPTASYAAPLASGGVANCGSPPYAVPLGARSAATSLNVDWSGVSGGNPLVAGTRYPICMLSYVLAMARYCSAGATQAQATTVRDYLRFVIGPGQLLLTGDGVAPMPSIPLTPANDVAGAAANAVDRVDC